MSRGRLKGGRHANRHRNPSALQRSARRTLDAVPSVPNGRSVALVAAGGVLATGTVVGSQAVTGDQQPAAGGESVAALSNVASESSAWDHLEKDSAVTATSARSGADVSRSTGRPSLDSLKQDSLQERSAESAGSHAASAQVEVEAADPRDIAQSMLAEYGWSADQFPCLDELWIGESQWQVHAENPTSGAYGIPQSLPAEKMASAGADWETNPETQIEWGLGYIADRYGSPCAANEFKAANNWY
ncbi:MAG: lytic transglycosylase domain-containing protein [Nocardioidaceae bacterium]